MGIPLKDTLTDGYEVYSRPPVGSQQEDGRSRGSGGCEPGACFPPRPGPLNLPAGRTDPSF